jgi:hypothetical protein
MPMGTPVTQNNVAREAGRDPSALKKSRFPRLVAAIQAWAAQADKQSAGSKRQEAVARRSKRRSLQESLASCKAERDMAMSMLIEADKKIVELFLEVRRLESLKVSKPTPLRPIQVDVPESQH